jgi:DNA-binding MarR family transcriptional regulator
MRVSSGILRRLDAFVEGTAMTPVEARILQFIAASAKPLNQKDIEAEYGYTAATVSEVIKNMEAKGLIRRDTDPDDRRKRRLTASADMASQVIEMRDRIAAMEADLTRGIDPEKLDVFMEVIHQMTKNISPRGQ